MMSGLDLKSALDERKASANSEASSDAVAEPPGTLKPRSCIVCRSRKVKCDKTVPCGNCRRAKIPCHRPVKDHVPRWARNLEKRQPVRSTANASVTETDGAVLMGRLRVLEATVVELRAQLADAKTPSSTSQGQTSASPQQSNSGAAVSPHSSSTPVGRLVTTNSQEHGHYVSSGFWSKVDNEMSQIDGLEVDEGESSDEGPLDFDHDLVAERFLFPSRNGHEDSRGLHPLPSQIPFLLEVFAENVYYIMPVVHMPSVQATLRRYRDNGSLGAAEESLAFSIYYCAIASMEEKAVLTNFGVSKSDLTSRYRKGLELSLARAEYIEHPSITTMQAWVLFLCLARRDESPRFVWMMVGMAIRMAHFLGLQRDGDHFPHLTPFEIEMRRRVWWAVINLEIRASEDQGTSPSIAQYDTRPPLNINDSDITPDTLTAPSERIGKTDMSSIRVLAGISETSCKLFTLTQNDQASVEEVDALLSEVTRRFEDQYFPEDYAQSEHIIDLIAHHVARIVLSKLTLLSFGAVIYDSANARLTAELRMKLLIASIELAEYNHVINTRKDCERFKWLYATHPHYYALVFLALELRRRPWTAISERGYIAMRTNWQLPSPSKTANRKKVWVPLHQLVRAVKVHRENEIARLRQAPADVARVEAEEMYSALPSSPGLIAGDSSHEAYRVRWRQLVQSSYNPSTNTSGSTTTSLDSCGAVPVQPSTLFEDVKQSGGQPISSSASLWTDDMADGVGLDSWLQSGGADGIFDGMDIDQDFDWNQWTQMARDME